MRKHIVLFGAFCLAVSAATASYIYSARDTMRWYGGVSAVDSVGETTTVQLFNPNPDQSVFYTLEYGDQFIQDTLPPLGSHSLEQLSGRLMLDADQPLNAWKVHKTFDRELETHRATLELRDQTQARQDHILPWISVFSESFSPWTGLLGIYNTSPFTATMNATVFDMSNGDRYNQASFQIPPFGFVERPALDTHPVINSEMWGYVYSSNGASTLVNYHTVNSQGAVGYWALPTSPFSGLAPFLPLAEGGSGLGRDKAEETRVGTSPFSVDYPIIHDGVNDITTRYPIAARDNTFHGFATVALENMGGDYIIETAAPTTNAAAQLEMERHVPDSELSWRGRVRIDSDMEPISSMLLESSGARASALKQREIWSRGVLPLDGREPWTTDMSASVITFDNQREERTVAVGLLDEDGNWLAVEYRDLPLGYSEILVADLVGNYPDTRSVIVESGGGLMYLEMGLVVHGSGAGFNGNLLDYINGIEASGCRGPGLALEAWAEWGSDHSYVPCFDQPANIRQMIELANRGFALPIRP